MSDRLGSEPTDDARQHQDQTQLASANQRFSEIVQAMPDIVMVLDLQGRNIECSDHPSLAMPRVDLIGKLVDEVIPGPAADQVHQAIAETTATGETVSFEYSLDLVGGIRTFSARIKLFGEQDVLTVIRDVTEQHVRTNELRLFKQSLDRTLDCVFMFDGESWQFNYVNRGATEQLGYTDAELLQMYPWDIKPEFTEVQFKKLIAPLVAGTQEHLKFETVHRRKDGHLVPVEISLQYIAATEHPGRFVAVVNDITDRKNAEAALRAVNDQLEERVVERTSQLTQRQSQLELAQKLAHIGNWSADLRTGHVIWSDELYDIFGRDPTTFTPSIDAILATIHPDDREQLQQSIDDALATAGEIRADHRIVLPDGSIRWVSDSGKAERDADGRPWRLTGTIQDITTRKEAEQELVLARDQAQSANLAKTEFLSHMSHELRTPLNAVLGFAQLLRLDTLTSDQTESVDEVLRAGEHLHDMVNQMLDLALIKSGDLKIDAEPVQLRPLAESCINIVRPFAAERGISISIDLVDNCVVFADPKRLRQVLNNLLSNAVKYNNDGGTIEVRWSSELQRVQISVQDNGIGIAPEAISRLFTPFERLESTYSGRNGAGIGLALCQHLMTAMQGQIEIDTELGRGTTVRIELPEVPGTGNTASTTPDTSLSTELHTVLCVEDNPTNLSLLERILLPSRGFRMIKAERGDIVLDLARQHQPGIILLDIGLPDIDGHEVLRQLRADPLTSEIPVVAVTADATDHNRHRSLAEGFVAYVTKPFEIHQLLELIEYHLSKGIEADP